jgi:hypothetical protein
MGACNEFLENMSPTVPPATLRKALPVSPLMNLPTSIVWIFLAAAHGTSQIMKNISEMIYIGRRP